MAGRPSLRAGTAGKGSSVLQRADATRGYNTPNRSPELPSKGACDRRRTGRGAQLDGKCTHRPQPWQIRVREDPAFHHAMEQRVESRESNVRSYPFASKRFHVLLNSLFKVLFNFPSRYLSAIGLVSVFSLRWSLPPALGCIPKQPDSKDAQRDSAARQ